MKLKVCADLFPPYQYFDKQGNIIGSDYEKVASILCESGYELDVTIADWAVISADFENGVYDVIFQIQDTPERLKKFFLSDKLRDAVTEVVTLQEELAGISAYSKLERYSVGVIDGFANGNAIDELAPECKRYFASSQELLDALDAGMVDCIVCDQGVRNYLRKQVARYRIADALTYLRPLYVMFHDRRLRDRFNEVMRQRRWFSKVAPLYGQV